MDSREFKNLKLTRMVKQSSHFMHLLVCTSNIEFGMKQTDTINSSFINVVNVDCIVESVLILVSVNTS